MEKIQRDVPQELCLVGSEEGALLLGRLTAAPDDVLKLPSISPLSTISSISHPIRKYAVYSKVDIYER